MIRGTKKYPAPLLNQILEYVHDHPGCSIHDLIPFAMSYFLAWMDTAKIVRRALVVYLNGTLKQIGKVSTCKHTLMNTVTDTIGGSSRANGLIGC